MLTNDDITVAKLDYGGLYIITEEINLVKSC